MRVLVTGGRGYVGAQTVKALHASGVDIEVLDDGSTGRADVSGWATTVAGDVRDGALVRRTLEAGAFDAVVHLAARTSVAESVLQPGDYWSANYEGTTTLLAQMHDAGPRRLVFASSAAVYGNGGRSCDETAPLRPTHPYGATKASCEEAIGRAVDAGWLSAAVLRYFNVAGADETGELGEEREHETHLIPNLLAAVLEGRPCRIHDAPTGTPDGSCVRDYVHVEDVADANRAALAWVAMHAGCAILNVATGRPTSSLELARALRRVVGVEPSVTLAPPRSGDPSWLVGTTDRARELLGWTPRRSTVERIVRDAWRWRTARERGAAA